MSVARNAEPPLVLPPGALLLHIGPPKTGTTALQHHLQAARSELYRLGVLYPGMATDHYRAVYAFMGRRDRRRTGRRRGAGRSPVGQVPPSAEWTALLREIHAEPSRRVIVSHESVARSSTAMAEAFVRELGADRTHIAITLRPPSELLPSRWSEQIKEGSTADPFDEWLRRYYRRSLPGLSKPMLRCLHQAGLVRRWADIVGPHRVTVIIADRHNPPFLPRVFEELLGLPPRTLTAAAGAPTVNRSMTLPEAEVIRRLNARLGKGATSGWRAEFHSVRTELIDRALARRSPPPAEPRLQLPDWAVPLVIRDGRRYADRIVASGVRIVGDLGPYRTGPASREGRAEMNDHRSGAVAPPRVAGALFVGALRGVASGVVHTVRGR